MQTILTIVALLIVLGVVVFVHVDCGAHGDDGIQRQAEELGELGKQIYGIEETAEAGQADRA